MKLSEDWTHKLFIAGLTIAVCSSLLLILPRTHYHFVFLPQYFGSFSEMFWQKPAITFEPALAYLRTTTGKVLAMVPLGGILLGFAMMHISSWMLDKVPKQTSAETVEQWLKENSPRKHQSKKRNKESRRRKRW